MSSLSTSCLILLNLSFLFCNIDQTCLLITYGVGEGLGKEYLERLRKFLAESKLSIKGSITSLSFGALTFISTQLTKLQLQLLFLVLWPYSSCHLYQAVFQVYQFKIFKTKANIFPSNQLWDTVSLPASRIPRDPGSNTPGCFWLILLPPHPHLSVPKLINSIWDTFHKCFSFWFPVSSLGPYRPS